LDDVHEDQYDHPESPEVDVDDMGTLEKTSKQQSRRSIDEFLEKRRMRRQYRELFDEDLDIDDL
jgi:hypothetical protein